MNLGGFERFFEAESRQDRGEAPGQHGFAASRRADEDRVVATGCSNFKSAFDMLLAAHFGEVGRIIGGSAEQSSGIDVTWLQQAFPGQKGDGFAQVTDSVNGEGFNQCSFGSVFGWQYQPIDVPVAGCHGDRQAAAHRFDTAVQGKLAEDGVTLLGFGGNDAGGGEEANGHGEIKRSPLFFYVGRSQIDRDPSRGKFVAGILDGGFDTILAFLDSPFREADGGELRQPLSDIDFHLDRISIDSEQSPGQNLGQHVPSCLK